MAQRSTVLQHVRNFIEAQRISALPDSELLERFVSLHEEAAFASLMRRHGPMVLSVCGRILRDPHSAEDAFQATFLALLRQASSIGRRHSVGSWLYRVAYRVALRARADTAKRRACERNLRVSQVAEEDAELIARDLRPILDEELDQLPEKLRAPVVLCYLEGKSNTEAACQLGWTKGTVSGRLAQARNLLRRRLTRRGVTLSAGLLGSILAENTAAAVPCPWLLTSVEARRLLAAGKTVGAISAEVAGLLESIAPVIVTTKVKIVAGLIILIGMVAAGTGTFAYHAFVAKEQGPQMPAVEKPRAANQPLVKPVASVEGSSPHLSTSGRVVDLGGKPIAGAAVYLREWTRVWGSQIPDVRKTPDTRVNDLLAQTATDKDGRFVFRDVPLSAYSFHWDIRVVAKGYGMAFGALSLDTQPVLLTMGPAAKLEGQLLDPDKKPAAGVHVQVVQFARLFHRSPDPNAPGLFHFQSSHNPLTATTDANGSFVLNGLPQNCRVTLLVQDDRFARQRIVAATTDRPPSRLCYSEVTLEGKVVDRADTVHPASFMAFLQSGHRLRGQVIFADDRRPVANTRVRLEPLSQSLPVDFFRQSFVSRTDAEGRFTLPQLFPDRYLLSVTAPADSVHLGANSVVEVEADKSESILEVMLPRGIPVTGYVVDEETGQGLGGVPLAYRVKEDGPGAPPPFLAAWVGPRSVTASDGRFRIVVPVRKGELLVGAISGYVAEERVPALTPKPEQSLVRPLDPASGKSLDGVRIALNRGLMITGLVLDPEDKPVAGARLEQGAGTPHEGGALSDADGRFTLSGLRAGLPHELYVVHPERQLAAKVIVAPDQDKKTVSVVVRLRPMGSVIGRVLDEEGQVVREATVQLYRVQRSNVPVVYTAVVDEEGRFRVDTLVPDVEYRVRTSAENYTSAESKFTAQSGQVDKLPDLTLQKTDRSISGVVITPGGKPLAGIRVSVESEGIRQALPSSQQPLVLTDPEGRFQVFGLPKGRVALRAYVLQTREGSTAPIPTIASDTVHADAGQQNVRLMLALPHGELPGEAIVGKPAPEFAVRKWLQQPVGSKRLQFSRADFCGKVVLLAFLDDAKPSQHILSQLNQAHEKLRNQGLIIVRVQEAEPNHEGARYRELAELSPTAAAVVAPGLVAGGYSDAFQKYAVKATPALFLIDRQGIMRYSDVEPDSLLARCEELVKH